MSSATTWPLPNQAYTRWPSVTGVGVARLCFSWTAGSVPVAFVRYPQSRRPSDRPNASTTSHTSAAAHPRLQPAAANRVLALCERPIIPGQLGMLRSARHRRPADL